MKSRWKILIVIGILLAGFVAGKWIFENLGLSKINMFGVLQSLCLGFSIVLICAGLIYKPGSRDNNYRSFRLFLIILFAVTILAHLPLLLDKAKASDKKYAQQVNTGADDLEYQILAVNLLNGYGFDDGINLPINEYHLDLTTPWGQQTLDTYQKNPTELRNRYTFYRAPGFPLMLAGTYALFGNSTMIARNMLVALALLTALCLLAIGTIWAGWIGTLAGGLVAIYYLDFHPGLFDFETILTEGPSAFLVACFSLCIILYLKKRSRLWLYLSAICLSFTILVRANWLIVVPFFLCYLWLEHISFKQLIIFGLITILPLLAWSTYASFTMDKLVILTTQGEPTFPQYNNRDVLEGIGPDHSGQGGWQPGREYDAQGHYINDRNDPEPGENGYIKGLTFWRDNITQLPRLFYVKLRRGFWYDNSWSVNSLRPEGIHLIGIGYLLMALGLKKPKHQHRFLPALTSRKIIIIQLSLISLLFLLWNQVSLLPVLGIWLLIFLLALLRPYGDVYELPFSSPLWFLPFILGHAATTLLYAGYRFHWSLDPILMIFSLTGIFLTLYELLKRKPLSSIPFAIVILVSMSIYYVFQ